MQRSVTGFLLRKFILDYLKYLASRFWSLGSVNRLYIHACLQRLNFSGSRYTMLANQSSRLRGRSTDPHCFKLYILKWRDHRGCWCGGQVDEKRILRNMRLGGVREKKLCVFLFWSCVEVVYCMASTCSISSLSAEQLGNPQIVIVPSRDIIIMTRRRRRDKFLERE